MKRRKITKFAISVLAISFCAVAGGFIAKGNSNSSYETARKASATVLNANVGGAGGLAGEGNYYSGIDDSLTGDSLLNALHSLNSQKRTKTVGYAGFKQFAAKCDIDPDGSGKIIGFYDNKKVGPSWDSGSTWNREHVWPNVRDGDKVENDAHMVRPASTSTNSGRGSKGFGTDSYDPGEYVPYYRGAAARIIFYAAIADTSLKVVDYSFPYDGVGSGNHGYDVGTMGSLSDMLRWNLQYSPKDTSFTGANDLARRTELNRNEVIQNASDGQGNRNPFIDHPEYACKIWGNTNATTKQICGNPTPTSTVSLDKTNASITVGSSTTVTATSSNGGNITWSTNNSNVTLSSTTTASGASVTVTGAVAGTTTLTAKNSDNVSASCVITIAAQTEPLKLNLSSVNLEIGGSENLIATTNDGSQVTYNFDDIAYEILDFNAIFTLNSGEPFKIKGLKDGTTTITVASSNGGLATCQVVVGTGQYVEPTDPDKPNKKRGTINTPLVLGLGIGGGVILIAGLIVLIVLLVKKKPV